MKNRILILSGDPNSINSELIYKRRAKGQSKLSDDQIKEMWKVYKTKGQDTGWWRNSEGHIRQLGNR